MEQEKDNECKETLAAIASVRNKLVGEIGKFADYSNYHVLIVGDIAMEREVTSFLLKRNGFFSY